MIEVESSSPKFNEEIEKEVMKLVYRVETLMNEGEYDFDAFEELKRKCSLIGRDVESIINSVDVIEKRLRFRTAVLSKNWSEFRDICDDFLRTYDPDRVSRVGQVSPYAGLGYGTFLHDLEYGCFSKNGMYSWILNWALTSIARRVVLPDSFVSTFQELGEKEDYELIINQMEILDENLNFEGLIELGDFILRYGGGSLEKVEDLKDHFRGYYCELVKNIEDCDRDLLIISTRILVTLGFEPEFEGKELYIEYVREGVEDIVDDYGDQKIDLSDGETLVSYFSEFPFWFRQLLVIDEKWAKDIVGLVVEKILEIISKVKGGDSKIFDFTSFGANWDYGNFDSSKRIELGNSKIVRDLYHAGLINESDYSDYLEIERSAYSSFVRRNCEYLVYDQEVREHILNNSPYRAGALGSYYAFRGRDDNAREELVKGIVYSAWYYNYPKEVVDDVVSFVENYNGSNEFYLNAKERIKANEEILGRKC